MTDAEQVACDTWLTNNELEETKDHLDHLTQDFIGLQQAYDRLWQQLAEAQAACAAMKALLQVVYDDWTGKYPNEEFGRI